ncbi:response regulator [Rhizobiaceae bacterium n13]|uniref:Response regulator n=1 Tax=Ferirhizobium litorale TaxID=2927786 RepID=A0AAE3QHM9_9HYPH|nr:response regulator [Fererhizobium litorale]MDI7865033.1 response regulator [Fererhizobium litorale]MDI7925201.1 response regulator [Fererhizobium litorale]
MRDGDHVVFVVDDDPKVRESVCDLLASVDLKTVAAGSVGEYLTLPRPEIPGCIVLDIELPDINGLEFQAQAAKADHPPVVFITGHGDIPSSVSAMKRGAVDFLTKPFSAVELIDAVRAGIEQDRQRREERDNLADLQERFNELTPRERQVFPLIVSGLLNKQGAAELGISEITFQVHRGRVMQKMRVASFADLVRIATKLDIPVTHSRYSGAHSK